MTKEEFIDRHTAELIGLIVEAFSVQDATRAGEDKDMALRGRMLMAQTRRAKLLLAKLFDELQPGKKP